MKKKVIFEGAATALITPTTETTIDYESFGKLIDWQIEEGINALVICGTSGESSTLSDEEHKSAISFAVERAAGRVPIIAGTGSNETSYAIELTKHAYQAGADAALVVTPYYNKATQNGLIKTYNAIADSADIPLIVYNVPSRTGTNIEPATYAKMAEHENIVAIKEANGNISKIVETMSLVGDQLTLYSGNDDQIVPLLSMGGKGVISVLSNILPAQTRRIVDAYLEGNLQESIDLQCKYFALIKALFSEVNPIPVKAAAAAMGFCKNYLRLPLTTMEEAHYQVLLAEMRKVGIGV